MLGAARAAEYAANPNPACRTTLRDGLGGAKSPTNNLPVYRKQFAEDFARRKANAAPLHEREFPD